MITNIGKGIIGKYLLGYAPSYASYIAIGCGKKPLSLLDEYPDYSAQKNLDFEMFRVPISSRGFVNEDGISKIVFTAELPTEERYEISEIGLYSAGSNPSAGSDDSKTIFSFSDAEKEKIVLLSSNPSAGSDDSKTIFSFSASENWQRHTSVAATEIPTISTPLDEDDDNIISTTNKVFQTNADNSIFYKPVRADRYERCRFLNNTVLISGNDADLEMDVNDNVVVNAGSNHIHLTGIDTNFAKNSPKDELRLALSVVSKDGNSSATPDSVIIMVEFASTESESPEYARFQAELVAGSGPGQYSFSTNRYCVISKELQDLYVSPSFTWDSVTVAKIYACAIENGVPTEDYYIALDAMRLENTQTTNPVYGLTGYSVVKNQDSEAVIKSPNTTNYVEFRFSIDIGAIV